jgi:hypothetical protein
MIPRLRGKLHGVEKPQGLNEIEAEGDGSVRLCTRLDCGPRLLALICSSSTLQGLWVFTQIDSTGNGKVRQANDGTRPSGTPQQCSMS